MYEPRQVGQHSWAPAIAQGSVYRRTLNTKFSTREACQAYCDKRNA
jgi:hypothetical protein